jgi:hypothetical protein
MGSVFADASATALRALRAASRPAGRLEDGPVAVARRHAGRVSAAVATPEPAMITSGFASRLYQWRLLHHDVPDSPAQHG